MCFSSDTMSGHLRGALRGALEGSRGLLEATRADEEPRGGLSQYLLGGAPIDDEELLGGRDYIYIDETPRSYGGGRDYIYRRYIAFISLIYRVYIL